jgi:hypothetical protein
LQAQLEQLVHKDLPVRLVLVFLVPQASKVLQALMAPLALPALLDLKGLLVLQAQLGQLVHKVQPVQ